MNSNFKKDDDLINALKKGDAKAYTFLVNQYHHKLCVYAFSLTKDHNLSEDIVQNVFMSIWNKKSNFREDLVLKSYLYKSVYNEFVDQYRKQKPVLSLEKKHFDVLSEIIEEEDGNSMEKLIKLIKKEIENLPPNCKQTFLLSKQDGLTNIEIAEFLNVSIKSVEAHITKGFSILRKTVGEKVNTVLFLLFGVKKTI
jgi:RNA polymerase sigma-70 factor (ECF subfamily)